MQSLGTRAAHIVVEKAGTYKQISFLIVTGYFINTEIFPDRQLMK